MLYIPLYYSIHHIQQDRPNLVTTHHEMLSHYDLILLSTDYSHHRETVEHHPLIHAWKIKWILNDAQKNYSHQFILIQAQNIYSDTSYTIFMLHPSTCLINYIYVHFVNRMFSFNTSNNNEWLFFNTIIKYTHKYKNKRK